MTGTMTGVTITTMSASSLCGMYFKALWSRKTRIASVLAIVLPIWEPLAQLPGRPASEPPRANYWVYVGAESADLMQRIRFGPSGAVVEKTIQVGELPADMEGPH